MQETRERCVGSLGWEDPLEKQMTTRPSVLAREIPWPEESGGLQSLGLQRIGHDSVCMCAHAHTHTHTHTHTQTFNIYQALISRLYSFYNNNLKVSRFFLFPICPRNSSNHIEITYSISFDKILL